MDRGFRKVMEKLPSVADKDIGNILKTIGMTLISSVGGAAGPLYGTFYMRSGMAVAAKEELDNRRCRQDVAGRRGRHCPARPGAAGG